VSIGRTSIVLSNLVPVQANATLHCARLNIERLAAGEYRIAPRWPLALAELAEAPGSLRAAAWQCSMQGSMDILKQIKHEPRALDTTRNQSLCIGA